MQRHSHRILKDVGGMLDLVLERRIELQMIRTTKRPPSTDGRSRRSLSENSPEPRRAWRETLRGQDTGGIHMNTVEEKRRGGGAKASRKLMAAIAVLAIAFAVLAAIPAIADDSEAATAAFGEARAAGDVAAEGTVELSENWTIGSGETISVDGGLIVPEGKTLTVEKGGVLTFTENSAVTIKGDFIIFGTAEIAGKCVTSWNPEGKLIIEQDASVLVKETGDITLYHSTVKESANLTIEGKISNLNITNYGTIEINSEVASTFIEATIIMGGDGAKVDITNLSFPISNSTWNKDNYNSIKPKLTVTDNSMIVYQKGDYTKRVAGEDSNSITITPEMNVKKVDGAERTISGITLVERLSLNPVDEDPGYGYIPDTGMAYDYRMEIFGKVSSDASSSSSDNIKDIQKKSVIQLYGKHNITVPAGEEFILGSNVKVLNNYHRGCHLNIEGTMDATAQGAEFSNYQTITVTGNGSIRTQKEIKSTGNATLYMTDSIYNYVEIDAALATVNAEGNEIKNLTVLGKQTVDTDATVPAKVTLGGTGTACVNGSLRISEGATVDVAVLSVGIDPQHLDRTGTGATASVYGKFTLKTAYVANGAFLDADARESLSVNGVKSLNFYTQGSLWFTAYSVSEASVTVDKAPLTDAVLKGWSETEGGEIIMDGETAQLSFPINGTRTALYAIEGPLTLKMTIAADPEIEKVTVNGEPWTGGYLDITAGQTYAISYTLKDGVYGTVAMLINGEKHNGFAFTAAGTSADNGLVKYMIQLDWSAATFVPMPPEEDDFPGYVPSQPSSGDSPDDDSTTQVAIVSAAIAVVLIAIIALLYKSR